MNKDLEHSLLMFFMNIGPNLTLPEKGELKGYDSKTFMAVRREFIFDLYNTFQESLKEKEVYPTRKEISQSQRDTIQNLAYTITCLNSDLDGEALEYFESKIVKLLTQLFEES